MIETEEIFMRRALELAALGLGTARPNPMVGAVIVHEGRIIGEGTGTNKKLAEQAGAHQALEFLNDPKARAELIQCQNSQK